MARRRTSAPQAPPPRPTPPAREARTTGELVDGGDLPERPEPKSLDFSVAFVATLYSNGERYKHDTIWHVDVTVDGDAVARIAEASRTGDYDDVTDLIAMLAADQFPWVGEADRVFEVSDVIDISITV